MNTNIDTTFDFTLDTPNYWENFINGKSNIDPDIYSPTLQTYHRKLWSKELPTGEFFDLNSGNIEYDYLYWKNFRFGSDSIINIYWYHSQISDVIDGVKKTMNDPEGFRKNYLHSSYTIGSSIIFPKHRLSINQCRGTNKKIRDRFDLTLECIKRFYSEETSPLENILTNDSKFFSLFGNFKNYIDFFYLQDWVENDYKTIKFLLPFDDFERSPYPLNKEEWFDLYEKQMDLLTKRNKRILQDAN